METKGAKTRKRIIEKTLQIFSLKGYFNTSVNDIVQAAGLTKGGIYVHFKSKEEIWWTAYAEAVNIWKGIVFKDVRKIKDPLERLKKVIENDMKNYIGADVFCGGCFFLNMLLELSGQSDTMSKRVLDGFIKFSALFCSWLNEAEEKKILKKGLNRAEIANFLVISLNGTASFYAATKDSFYLDQTVKQLHFFIDNLRK